MSSTTPGSPAHGVASTQRPYEWLLMYYFSGDNELSPEMVRTMKEIAEVEQQINAERERVAIVMQYDPLNPSYNTLRFDLTQDPAAEISAEVPPGIPLRWAYTLGKSPHILSGSLTRFLSWASKKHATRRALILSGHGTGSELLRGENPPSALTLQQLAKELKVGLQRNTTHPDADAVKDAQQSGGTRPARKLDVLGLDTCVMGTLDTVSAVSDAADYLIASEGSVRASGWPHAHLLQQVFLRENGAMYPALHDQTSPGHVPQWCTALLSGYGDYYRDHRPAGVSVDLTASALSKAGDVRTALETLTRGLAKAHAGTALWDLVVVAHWRAQSFNLEQYADLWDFSNELRCAMDRHPATRELGRDDPWASVRRACGEVIDALDAMIAYSIYVGPDYQHAHGVSIHFPWSPLGFHERETTDERHGAEEKEPAEVATRATGFWQTFLTEHYLPNTMREMRDSGVPVHGRVQGLGEKKVSPLTRGAADLFFTIFGDRLPWAVKNPALRTKDDPQEPARTTSVNTPSMSMTV